MGANKSHIAILVGILIALILVVAIGPFAIATAGPSVSNLNQPAPTATKLPYCDNQAPDGVCDPYYEDEVGCPEDCATPTVAPATATPQTPPTATIEPTEQPTEVPTTIPTEVPTSIPVTPGEGLNLEDFFPAGIPETCEQIRWIELSEPVQEAYLEIETLVEDYVPPDDEIVIRCLDPLATTLCLPLNSIIFAEAGNFANRIGLVDCSGGECEIVDVEGRLSRAGNVDTICYDFTEEDDVNCLNGCLLAPLTEPVRGAGGPDGRGEQSNLAILIISLAGAVGLLAALIYFLFFAGSREEEEEEDREI